MSPQPTGRVSGNDLILTRRFRAPIEDVWTSVTDPEHTARWYGTWEGEPGVGKTIRLQMAFEEGQPWFDTTIDVCEQPRHLALSSQGEWGVRLELTLVQTGETTEMTFVHHLKDRKLAKDFGPGWEYYLDNLVAAREGKPLPKFADYHPAQQPYFADQV